MSSGVIQFGIDLESLGHMTLKLFKKLHLHISNHDRFSTLDQFSVIVYHIFTNMGKSALSGPEKYHWFCVI